MSGDIRQSDERGAAFRCISEKGDLRGVRNLQLTLGWARNLG
jgi:hypothetical protein